MRVRVCACVRACACARVRACVRVCVRACVTGGPAAGGQPEVYLDKLAGNQRAVQTPSDADWALVRQPPWARPGLNAY